MNLCLSLGHNSSAVLVNDDGVILIGYENERLTEIKSDSQFPVDAIKEIGKYYDLEKVMYIYVSHWATFGDIDEMSAKHWRRDILEQLCPNANLHGNTNHHDCHVGALRAFTSIPFEWEIVADGFGNFNETMSIYHNRRLVHRCFGFEKSLGLFYQYVTAHLGMKMNQDEYKLLGYESHITKVVPDSVIRDIQKVAEKTASKLYRDIIESPIQPKYDAVAGLEALPSLRLQIHSHLDYIFKIRLGLDLSDEFQKRVIIAFYAQTVIESTMLKVIDYFDIKEVALTGGIFMNVKLNNVIAKVVDKISILPICGDQSCGIGAYNLHRGNLVWPNHLFWAKRGPVITLDDSDYDMVVFDNEEEAFHYISLCLNGDKIVNFITGNGEFGARSLGNTSTLALPYKSNVEYINYLNDRSSIMPMAGMVSDKFLTKYKDHVKVHKSLEYMIMTLDLGEKIDMNMYRGCHHNHPLNGSITNRVQLVDNESVIGRLVDRFDCLINTSFNIHGVPIVLTSYQIQRSHSYQKDRDMLDRVVTVILNKGESDDSVSRLL